MNPSLATYNGISCRVLWLFRSPTDGLVRRFSWDLLQLGLSKPRVCRGVRIHFVTSNGPLHVGCAFSHQELA